MTPEDMLGELETRQKVEEQQVRHQEMMQIGAAIVRELSQIRLALAKKRPPKRKRKKK